MRIRTHPGEIIREDMLPELGLSAAQLADAIGVPLDTVADIIAERSGVTPDIAARLGRQFGNPDA